MTGFRSKRLGSLGISDIRTMTKECVRVGGINMGQGVCDMPTPVPVKDAAIAAIENRESRYSYAEGTVALREKIAEKLKRDNNIIADPNSEVVVTVGSTGAFCSTMLGLLNPGDGMILFEPYYGYHLNCAAIAGIEPQFVTLKAPDFSLDEVAIRAAIKPNTRAIVVCTPANPSGKMYTRSELELIDKIAEEFDLLVISDEIYEYIRYDGQEHISPASVGNIRERSVTIMGVSKTFSVTGWRLGYATARPEMAQALTLVSDIYYICAPTPLQLGAAAGFDMDKSFFDDLQTKYQSKRDKFCGALKEAGMNPIIPKGAYYVLADISDFGFKTSKEAALHLLETCKIASVPGTAFYQGDEGQSLLRFCFAIEDHLIDRACEQVLKFKPS